MDKHEDETLPNSLIALGTIELYIEESGQKQGKIDCPICGGKGTLSYTRGPRSVWVACKTEGCVRFHGDMR